MAKDDVADTAPLKYPQIKVPRLKGSEQVMDHEHKPISTVMKFWQWAYSGLSDNVTRGVLAEFFVANAVGAARGVRDPWATYDVEDPRGFGIEVKSTAYIQTWAHDAPGALRKSISLETLRASKDFGKPVSYRTLAARIGKVAGLAES